MLYSTNYYQADIVGDCIMKASLLAVGINKFKNYPHNSLQGCVNDTKLMKTIFNECFGGGDVSILTDKKATRAAIFDSLAMLVAAAQKGLLDCLVFSMSSHGTQVIDKCGDELDGLDEAFCPYDAGFNGEGLILDDDLYRIFLGLPKEVRLEVFLDTCHSGDASRAFSNNPHRVRYLPVYKDMQVDTAHIPNRVVSLTAVLPYGHIFWSGCKSNQTSADARYGLSCYGAFTYNLHKQLKRRDFVIPRAELLREVVSSLQDDGYSQIPQLECCSDFINKDLGK